MMLRLALAAVAATITGAAIAQTSTQPPPPPLIDWEKTQIKTTDLGHNTYRLEGQGGNITIAVGTDGIIMVDSQYAPLSDKIKAAIKALSPLPVKYLINTHFHATTPAGTRTSPRTARSWWRMTTSACGSRADRCRSRPVRWCRRLRPKGCRSRPISAGR